MNKKTLLILLAHLKGWRKKEKKDLILDLFERDKFNIDFFVEPDEKELKNVLNISEKKLDTLFQELNNLDKYENIVNKLEEKNISILPFFSEYYPESFVKYLGSNKVPELLYLIGNPNILTKNKISIVGSRDANEDSIKFARKISNFFTQKGFSIVSGFAKGVDEVSIKRSLNSNGSSIGVLPTGILNPPNKILNYTDYIEQKNLLLVSPFFPEASWSSGLAMARNKYIYALSSKIFVVQAGYSGGTWSGVRGGLKQIKKSGVDKKIYVRKIGKDKEDELANNLLIERGGIGVTKDLQIEEKNTKQQENLL